MPSTVGKRQPENFQKRYIMSGLGPHHVFKFELVTFLFTFIYFHFLKKNSEYIIHFKFKKIAFSPCTFFILFLESELISGPHTGIPWQSGLRRGSALEADGDSILVKEEGFYFVYSQVGPFAVTAQFLHTVVPLV